MAKLTKGLIQIYTGNGKGKTTAAFGLALRAMSHGYKIAIVQFFKANDDKPMAKLIPGLDYYHFGLPHQQFGWLDKSITKTKKSLKYQLLIKIIHEAWQKSTDLISSNKYDIVILDELTLAFYFEVLPVKQVIETLKTKPAELEIIITGRKAPKALIQMADLVSNIQEIKHPYQKGIIARKGIEY